jgi:hypothetical protein
MEKIQVYNSIQNGGDGSAYSKYFLTKELAEEDQRAMYEPWGEDCIDIVETYVGSNVCNMAIENSPTDIYLVPESCKHYNKEGCTYSKYINLPETSCTKLTCPLVVDELNTLVVDGTKYVITKEFKTMCKEQGINPSAMLIKQITDALNGLENEPT